jgi:hypothetical protein
MTAANNRHRAVRLQHVKRALFFPPPDQRPQAGPRAVFASRLLRHPPRCLYARIFVHRLRFRASALESLLPDTLYGQPRRAFLPFYCSSSKSRRTTCRRLNDALPVTHQSPVGAPVVRPRGAQHTASAPHRPSRHAALGPAPAQARAQPAATATASGCAVAGTAGRRPRGRRCRCRRPRRRRCTAATDSGAHRALSCPVVRGARADAARRHLRVHLFRGVRDRPRRCSSVACE